MSTVQYIGARYVPIFADPIEWSNTKQYEPLTIVIHEGNSFTSKQFVPIGIDISDSRYWALTGNYNAQVEMYRAETAAAQQDVNAVEDLIPSNAFSAENTVKAYIDNLAAIIPSTDFDSGNTVKDAIEKRLKCYDTVADMVSDQNLEIGDTCATLGYYEIGVGGAIYQIVENATQNGMDILRTVNGFAMLSITNNINVDMFGAFGDGTHDDTNYFRRALKYCGKDNTLYLSAKVYKITDYISHTNTNSISFVSICGAGPAKSPLASTDTPKYEKGSVILLVNENVAVFKGESNSNSELYASIKNTTFYTTENVGTNYIFDTLRCRDFKFYNNSTRFIVPFNNCALYSVCHIYQNQFYNCYPFMKNCAFVDSYIHDNYISGNGNGYCFEFTDCSHSKIYDNFFDFYKIIYTGYFTDISSHANHYEVFGNVISFDNTTSKSLNFVSVGDTFDAFSWTYLNEYSPAAKATREGILDISSPARVFLIAPNIGKNGSYIINTAGDGAYYKAYATSKVVISNPYFQADNSDLLSHLNIVNIYQPANTSRPPYIFITGFIPIVDSLPTTENFWNGMEVIYQGNLYKYIYGWKQITT